MFVEGLRGIAALYVVLSHFRSMVDPSELAGKASSAPEWLRHVLAPFSQGPLAVAAFIVLSGFCLQVSLFNGKDGRISDLRRFFIRRAWRILPPYYACLALSIVVALTVTVNQHTMPFDQYVPVTARNVWAHVFLVHNFSADTMYKINGVLWSIAIEAQLYLLFPWLVAALFKIGRVGILLLTTAIAVAVLGIFPESIKLYPWFLPLFALGMVTAHFAYRPNARVGVLPGLGLFVFVAGIGTTAWAVWARQAIPITNSAVALAVAGMIYLGSVAPHQWLPRAFAWRPLAAMGAFSYSLYLIHHPIEQVLYVFRPSFIQGPAAGVAYLLVVGLPIILLASYGFSRVFERPFILNRKVVEPVLRDGLGTPLSLPLRTAARTARLEYVEPRKRTHAVVQITEGSGATLFSAPG